MGCRDCLIVCVGEAQPFDRVKGTDRRIYGKKRQRRSGCPKNNTKKPRQA